MNGSYLNCVAQFRILERWNRPDAAILADRGAPENLRERPDDGILADPHRRIDGHRLRPLDGDAVQHQFLHLAIAENLVHRGQLHARVDAQQFAGIGDLEGGHVCPARFRISTMSVR